MKKNLLDDRNYLRFSELIQRRTGIQVGGSRREALARALKESSESLECTDLDQFFSCLQEARTDSEVWNDLIKRVTIGETYFFRDSDTIKALRQNILPDLIARHQTDRTLRLWSTGCATGEEPYTLAILLHQILSDIDQWKILILATDINRQALKHASAGRYRTWSFRETNPVIRSTYFTHDGNTYTIDPVVREKVTFAYLNLADDSYPSPTNQTSHLDLILCRNVTIYLPRSLIQTIANRFYQCLSHNGWLIVGPSETHLEIYSKFQTLNFHGVIAYQKVARITTSTDLRTTVPEQINRRVAHPQLDLPFGTSSTHHSTDDSRIVKSAECETSTTKQEVDFCQQGEELMKQQRYDEARQCFLSCLSKEASSITARYRMACLEANVGRLNEARKWAEQALDQDQLRSEVHYTLALIHELQGEMEEGINQLKKVIYLDPNFILAHFGLFHLYQRTGTPTKAERHRILAVHLASKLSPDTVLSGSDDLTAGQLLTMAQAVQRSQMVTLGRKS